MTRLRPMPTLGPVAVPLITGQPIGRCSHCCGTIVLRLNEDLGEVMLDHLVNTRAGEPASRCTGWESGGKLHLFRGRAE